MSFPTSSSQREDSLVSVITGVFRNVLTAALSPENHWQKLQITALPLLASVLWHYSHTVVTVTDNEHVLWIQLWLSQQTKALERVRRLRVLPTTIMSRRTARQLALIQRGYRMAGEDLLGGEQHSFVPPELDFQPDCKVTTWTWFGCWPISVVNNVSRTGNVDVRGYVLTIWFSPFARSIVKELLFQGRKHHLAKKAKKTEIWIHSGHSGFKILVRSSRPLSSVIVEGKTKEKLKEDALHFLEREKWYIGKGIPYRRGYLLHGPPGCGKTSLITALAGDLKMPIVVLALNDKNMDDQSLFTAMSGAPQNSIVLIEDIDCALPKDDPENKRNMYGRTPVTLSGLLNAIDGVGAQEGRLLFMTTNHLDRLDDALIRPGRVDVMYHLAKASKEGAAEMFDQFFSSSSADPSDLQEGRRAFLQKVENGEHSFAFLQGVFMTADDNPGKVATAMEQHLASRQSVGQTKRSRRNARKGEAHRGGTNVNPVAVDQARDLHQLALEHDRLQNALN